MRPLTETRGANMSNLLMPSECDHPYTGQTGEPLDQQRVDGGADKALSLAPAHLIKPHTATTLCTKALYRFLRRHAEVFDFFFFAVELATGRDQMRFIAAKALAETNKDHAEAERVKDQTFKYLRRFSALQSENICIGTVANFLSYLSETIQSCIKSRPEMLRSNETIKIEDVLRFDSRELLIEFLVERKINELSYAGIKGINDFLLDRIGIELWASDEECALSSVSVELRNIYTHNRGIVNETFLKKPKGSAHPFKFSLGERFHAGLDDIALLANNMFTLATRLDDAVVGKFNIYRQQYEAWDKPEATHSET
jgi:hypothetical protein